MHPDDATDGRLDRLAFNARIDLSDISTAQRDALDAQLTRMLEWYAISHGIDVDRLAPLLHPADIQTWMRADEVEPSLGAEALMRNAPAHDQDAFLVPQVVDDNS